ncbi:MAG: MMPL family transporter [Planctomycetaceae bacterium]
MGGGPVDAPVDGALSRLLRLLTRLVMRRYRAVLVATAVSIAVCALLAAVGLRFKTSRSDLIDPSAPFQQRWLKFTEKFGDQSDIVVVVESDRPALVRVAMDSLGGRLLAEPDLFAKVSWKFDPTPLRAKGLQYLSPVELEQGLARIESYGPILQGHWNRAGLESYCQRLGVHARWAEKNNRPAELQQMVEQASRLCESLARFTAVAMAGAGRKEQTARRAASPSEVANAASGFQSPWPEIFSNPGESLEDLSEVRYQLTDDGCMGFVTTTATAGEQDFSGTSPTLSRLRQLIAEAQDEFPGVTLGLTGIPVLESDEMQRSQADMTKASLISLGGVTIVLLFGFRGLKHPLLGLLMLVTGIAWTIGYTTLAIGHLNILSVSFAAILIGLGIDFAVHYLSRYLELRQEGHELESSLEQTSGSIGTGLVTAAITTSLAFLCAAFTRFLGVAELGIIAGGGILLCGVAAFVVLPALVRWGDGGVNGHRIPRQFQGTILRWVTQYFPRLTMLVCLVAVVAVGSQAFRWEEGRLSSRVEYDSNLLNLQADDVESVEVQHRVFDETNGSLLFAVSLAGDHEAAKRQADRFRALDSVAHVEHLAHIIPEHSPAETALLVQAIHARLAKLAPLPRQFPPIDPLAVGQGLEELHRILRDSQSPAGQAAAVQLDTFLDRFEQVPLEQQVQLLGGYQYAMLTALRTQFERIGEISNPDPVTPQDLPVGVRERFISTQGDWMLRIFPREQVWDEAPLEHFVSEVRQIDPEATGTPVQNYEAARQIRQSYLNAGVYAFLVVCLVLLIDTLASGPLCVALLTPLIVVAFAMVTLLGPNQSWDYRGMLCLYVAMAVLVGAIFDFVNVRNMVLSLAPPILGLGLMFGALGYLGVHLNPANIIVLPLLLGIGVDYGVLVVHDFRSQSHLNCYRTSSSTINAVLLTSLTSMVGFGSLMTASHRGLQSLGLVLVVGVGSCLFVALVALPAVLTWIAGSARSVATATNVMTAPAVEDDPAPVLLALPSRSDDVELVGRTLRAAS